MSLADIENAIRQLPASEARALLDRVRDDLNNGVSQTRPLTNEVIAKWQVRSGFAAGMTTDQYLRLVRDGDRN